MKTLLVAEAPPSSEERYFYFEDVTEHDSLFRYVCKGILGRAPDRQRKREALAELRERGVFLVDLSEEPMNGVDLRLCVDGLISRCESLRPERIILIKTSVYDAAFTALHRAGLPVVDERIPFPGSGQQRKFESTFAKALAA